MGPVRLSSGFEARRGICRAAVVSALVVFGFAFASACGSGGEVARTDSEKGSDTEILNAALARELSILDAYTRGRQLLRGPAREVARAFRGHQQEYVNAITKAIRGLGGETAAEPQEVDFDGVEDGAGFLALAYELESAALASYLDDAPRLFTPAPRTLAASLAAGHAQHLVPIRQQLGAGLAASAPEAFDGGQVPPPRAAQPAGQR